MEQANQVIRIAEIVGNAVTGGVPSQVVNLVRHMDHDRFVCDFYTYGPSRYDEEIRSWGGEVYYIPKMTRPWAAVPPLKRLLKQGRYDIVHSHMTALSVVPLYAAKRAKVGVRIAHAHSSTHPDEKTAWIKNTLKRFAPLYATHLAACSRSSALWMYGAKKGEKATVIRNAVDLERFAPTVTPDPALLEWSGGSRLVGMVGRMVFQKNVPFLVDAFAYLTTLDHEVKLVLVGDGDTRREVERRILAYDLADKVKILEETPHIQRYIKAFDLFALPSLYEGLPLVVMEAQAMGVPVLASDQVTEEADMGGVTFFPLDSSRQWGDKMYELLSHPTPVDCRATMRERGFDMAEEGKRLEGYYLDCIGGGK